MDRLITMMLLAQRPQQADDRLAGPQPGDHLRRRRADAGEHAGPVGHVLPAGDRRAGPFVGAVGKPRRRACSRLDQNPDARAGQRRD